MATDKPVTAKKTAAAKKPAPAKAAAKAPAKRAAPRKAAPRKAPAAAPAPAPVAESAPKPFAIEVGGLRKSFKGGVDAVNGVDLSVREGEVFGFLGPNGAGKTTTVRMLCTLLPITAGTARVAGVDVVRDPAAVRRKIGVALQEIGLDPIQTGREILELQCGLYGMNAATATARTKVLLDLVGLTDAADRRTKTYSGGMKRRLDLASALVHEPTVLFLDEPTTGLDPASRVTVWDEVRRINDSGTTVFLTTQYLEEADQLCDRLAIIDRGVIVAAGTPEELKSAMGHDVVTITVAPGVLGSARAAVESIKGLQQIVEERNALALYVDNGAAAVPDVVRRLDQAGVEAKAISIARPTLDDVFLKATGRRLEGDDETTEETA